MCFTNIQNSGDEGRCILPDRKSRACSRECLAWQQQRPGCCLHLVRPEPVECGSRNAWRADNRRQPFPWRQQRCSSLTLESRASEWAAYIVSRGTINDLTLLRSVPALLSCPHLVGCLQRLRGAADDLRCLRLHLTRFPAPLSTRGWLWRHCLPVRTSQRWEVLQGRGAPVPSCGGRCRGGWPPGGPAVRCRPCLLPASRAPRAGPAVLLRLAGGLLLIRCPAVQHDSC